MIDQPREILPLGQTVRIRNICAEGPAVATTFKPPLSRKVFPRDGLLSLRRRTNTTAIEDVPHRLMRQLMA
jgi:hypothetical protein